MAINFPNAPLTNDEFTANGKTWYFTGSNWTLKSITSTADGTIGTLSLADASVTTIKLASNSVTTAKMVDNSVTTAKMVDNSVTYAKLGSDVEIPFIMGVY